MPKPPARCGTASGYNRHLRLKETPCIPCSEAKWAYNKAHRSPQQAANDKARTLAHSRALGRLRDLHREAYEALFREELAKITSPTTTEGDKPVTQKQRGTS
jgi:hypothetical protein